MTKAQVAIVWVVGLLVSGVLFYVGIGKPYQLKQNPPQSSGTLRQRLLDAEVRRQVTEERQRWENSATPNYYVGALAPVLILGTCAFLGTMRKSGEGSGQESEEKRLARMKSERSKEDRWR